MLTTVHFAVVNATNGKEALDLLSSGEDIDMVLTDVLMPEASVGHSADRAASILVQAI